MKKLIAKILCITLLSLTFVGSVFAKDYPEQSKDFYVNDLANIIGEENEQYIVKTNDELFAKTKGQIVVMTIKNLEGESIEKYATGVFRQYGIGGKDEKNGTLILISTEDRLIRIETGSGTEGFIPDARAGKIINEAAKPYLKDDNWDDGIRATFDAVLGCYLQEYNIEIDGSTASYVSADEEMSSSEMGWLIAIFSSFFFVPLIGSASEKSKTFAWIARIASIVTAIVSAIYVSQPTQAILFMICVLVFFATFGITASSGGGRRFGGSSFSSGGGGRSGGGGTSRGGGATGRF